jgi:hypothetical protein
LWPDWTNTLYDFSAGTWPADTFSYKDYTGTPVSMENADNSFPNPLKYIKYLPVNPKTMKALPRPNKIKMDIGAFAY